MFYGYKLSMGAPDGVWHLGFYHLLMSGWRKQNSSHHQRTSFRCYTFFSCTVCLLMCVEDVRDYLLWWKPLLKRWPFLWVKRIINFDLEKWNLLIKATEWNWKIHQNLANVLQFSNAVNILNFYTQGLCFRMTALQIQ